MNLKLAEWNKSCEYAQKISGNLTSKGYNIKVKPYSMYNGDRGLHIQIFDNQLNFFTEYATGIVSNYNDMVYILDKISNRIVSEC